MKHLWSIVFRFFIVVGLFSGIQAFAQQYKTITGSVFDTKNETIVGATVSVSLAGELIGGTVTDQNGNFNMSVPEGSILEVSFVGYASYLDTITQVKDVYNVILTIVVYILNP